MSEARPPAKVNLTLEVVGRRDDGYHGLRSIFLRVGLSDRLTMAPGTGVADRLTVTGLPGAPTEGNLVLKALDALRRHAGANLSPLDVTLDKQIPAAAGLGGGSSDAASALKLAQGLWGVRLEPDAEVEIATSLGSDVPFFYIDMPAAHVSGRGEHLESLAGPYPGLGLLLVTPPIALSTRSAFGRFDERDQLSNVRPGAGVTERIYEEVFLDEPTTEEMLTWAPQLRDANDLWDAAASLAPALPTLRAALERTTDVPWLMSGSGPTLFALYPSVEEASAAGQSLVRSRLPELESAVINAVDMIGPDPKWRHP